jgi:hypothetical protein
LTILDRRILVEGSPASSADGSFRLDSFESTLHDSIHNQPEDVTRRMVLAKAAAGDLVVAYLPENDAIEVDLSVLPAPLAARWFDPLSGRFTSIAGRVENKGTHRFSPPAKGDWVLLLIGERGSIK